ncbi:MAG: hypothetical protein IJD04_01630, partial [Desulfovibrionaceae bacterium]|nr:hypothetical protein [Desulfovibrionaceae bacterium]
MKRTVHQHSLLAKHGGAARVRQILSGELSSFGWEASASCEIFDFSEAESGDVVSICLANP